MTLREIALPATTHGRILVAPAGAGPLRMLAGFHGYGQNAEEMMEMLRGAAADGWTLVSIQGLHRFYRGRTTITVASWMTRQDRELLIDDNVRYTDAALSEAASGQTIDRLVCCGFSQGAAMAFRAGLLGSRRADGVIALGGDVPPELLAHQDRVWPLVLMGRGNRDPFYSSAKLAEDEAALRARHAAVETLTFDGAHEWSAAFAARASEFLRRLV